MNAKLPNTPKAWVDPDDAPELDETFFRNATPLIDDRPASPAPHAKAVRRGHPVGSTQDAVKVPTTIRLSPEVSAAFRATGQGWQTRIDAALKDWLKDQSPA
ncbi:hypothetical protein [Polaromonas sp. CG9_12]|nr:hypothetical protein [Polaromonas sp. CG9_12]